MREPKAERERQESVNAQSLHAVHFIFQSQTVSLPLAPVCP